MRKLLCSVLAAVMSVGSFVSLPTAGVGVAAGAAAVMVVATPAPAAAAEMSEMLRYACIYYFNGRIEYLGMANDFAEASPEVATITGQRIWEDSLNVHAGYSVEGVTALNEILKRWFLANCHFIPTRN